MWIIVESHWDMISVQLIGQFCILTMYLLLSDSLRRPPFQKNTDITKVFYFPKRDASYNLDDFSYVFDFNKTD